MKKNIDLRSKSKLFAAQLLFMFMLSMASCKKDNAKDGNLTPENTSSISVVDGRLAFKTTSSFKNLMSTLATEKVEKPSKTVEKMTSSSGFLSIASVLERKNQTFTVSNIGSTAVSAKSASPAKMLSMSNSFTSNLSKVSLVQSSPQEMEVVDAYEEQIEQLIPDENFAAVLNENLEVMVENTIYKVTPYGTFMIEQPAYTGFIQRLDAIPYEENQVLVDDPFYQNRISDNVYQIEEGVTLIDTYEASVNQIENVLQVQDYPVTYSATWQYRPDSDAWIYDNLPTIKYGGKTWAGKLFESILGREEIHTENFESKRRVRVNFYNMSWGVYSSIGVSVKMQKKNWIGWSGTNASELRMGWDAMEYYIGSLPSAPPTPISTTPQRFTKLDLPKVTKDYVEVDLLGYPFTFDRNEALQKGIKKIHEMLPTVPGLKPKSERTVNYAYKVWADFGKRSISIVQDRDEIIGYNTESLSKVFDWSVGVKASWGFDGAPTLGYAPLKFTISRASVFGIAKYNNTWKGARIVVGN